MIELTRQRALELLTWVVEDHAPDYRYTRMPEEMQEDYIAACVYASEREDGTLYPRCLIGHVLERLGGPALLAAVHDQHDDTGDPVNEFHWESLGVHAEDGATWILAAAQSAQDRDHTWPEALADAEVIFKKLV